MAGLDLGLCLFHLVYLSSFFQVTAVPFVGVDDNCVLSFVVPRDKMKSSCELDEKVNRRINSMETKVNIYKQQVSDMQVQSDKQRQLHADKITKMEELVKDISVNMDMSFLIERRLALLEKEFQQLQSDMSTVKTTSTKWKSASTDDKTGSLIFNTVDNSHTLSGLAKSMIQAEINTYMDSFTKRVEGYVQEQVVVYNKVFNMLPHKRNEYVTSNGRTSDTSTKTHKEKIEDEKINIETKMTEEVKIDVDENKKDETLIMTEDEYEKEVVSFLENTTREDYVDNVKDESVNDTFEDFNSTEEFLNVTEGSFNSTGEYLNVTKESFNSSDEYLSVTEESFNSTDEYLSVTEESFNSTDEYLSVTKESFNSTDEYLSVTEESFNATSEINKVNSTNILRSHENTIQTNSSKVIDIDDLINYNGSFVEDSPDAKNSSQTFVVSHVNDKVSKSATSRINSNHEKDSRDKTDLDNDYDKNVNEFMVHDQQFHKQTEIEGMIQDEIETMLLPPLAKVMSLIEDQKHSLEEKIKLQDKKYEKVSEDLTKRVKSLDSSVQTVTLRMESLSKEIESTSLTMDKLKSLEALVSELQKNITVETLTVSVHEVDEQNKKLKKLERLMGVYHQSMERYRNETKNEFRDIRESLEKETIAIRTASKVMQSNLTSIVNSQVNKQNSTFMNRVSEITEQLKMQDQNLLMVQLDLANVEKAVSGRASRFSDRDVDKLQDEMSTLAARQREFKKKLDHLDQSQSNLSDNLNLTSTEVSALKMEVKLSLEQWIPLSFEYDTSKTDCFGDQFVKRSHYSKSLLVGVVLCSSTRYKIFLSSSLHGKFLNIGDGNGVGEDHCEFVGATNGAEVKLSQLKPTFGSVQGYARNNWGDKPIISYLNAIKPSPHWYECGVEIP